LFVESAFAAPPSTPLSRAHAHNDYEHPRPLLDALDHGFCSVEADVYLVDGKLLIAHTVLDLKPDRTLEKLYLAPLRERVKANGGKVYKDGPVFHLLIDVKSEAKKVFPVLAMVLEGYADILTTVKDGRAEVKAVTVVISGNCDREAIEKATTRRAAIDGRPGDLKSDAPTHLIPWVSADWATQFKWNGTGDMPAEERAKLKHFVAAAHKQGRLVRFWGTPEKQAVWKELLAADVDLINTDKLPELSSFLREGP
jgi:hypothetical protein